MVAATRRTYSCTSSAACLNQPRRSEITRRSGPPRRRNDRQLRIPEPLDLVAECRRLLEIQIRGGRLHLALLGRQVRLELLLVVEALGAVNRRGRRHVIA